MPSIQVLTWQYEMIKEIAAENNLSEMEVIQNILEEWKIKSQQKNNIKPYHLL